MHETKINENAVIYDTDVRISIRVLLLLKHKQTMYNKDV